MLRTLRDCAPTGKRVNVIDSSGTHARWSSSLVAPDLDVCVTRLDMNTPQVQQCSQLLSPDEREHAKRFYFARDRRRYTVARATLRMLLAERTGLSPAAIVFVKTQHGKPYLASPPTSLHFNLSHSGERAIVAVSGSSIPGVDIEHLERNVDHAGIAQRFFTPRENAELQLVPAAERKRTFLAWWTCKEAIAKAIGHGLQLPLNMIEVSLAAGAEPRILSIPCGRIPDWSLYRVDADRDYVATVAAYRGPAEEITLG